MRTSADVIVVGAGPAGCAAAYDLATAGYDVLLLDRHTFPRGKPCAGALTPKTLRALRFPVTPVVRHVTTNLTTTWNHARRVRFRTSHLLAALTVRPELDDYVLGQTLSAGARFCHVGALRRVRLQADGVELETADERFSGRYLIGADGADSTVRRLTAEFPSAAAGLAIEACIPRATDSADLEFDFGVVRHGYGWAFPKGDHINVGLYSADPAVRLRPADVRAYARTRFGLDAEHLVGQRVGQGGWSYRPRHPRVFLVGDAAGLAEPLLGEGIYYAVKSGQAAAEAIAAELGGSAAALDVFRAHMATLGRDVEYAHHLAQRFHADARVAYRVLTTPVVAHLAAKGTSLGLTIREVVRRSYALPFLPVSAVPGF